MIKIGTWIRGAWSIATRSSYGWLVRALPYICALIGGVAGVLWIQGKAYDNGYNARDREVLEAELAHNRVVAGVNEKIASARAEGEQAVRDEMAARPAARAAMKETLRANPDFAAVRRPPAGHAQRVRELDAINAARGPDR
jgi:hypothetical protein